MATQKTDNTTKSTAAKKSGSTAKTGTQASGTTQKKKPTSAALKAAVAQLEEEETGKKKNTVLLRVLAFVLWILAAAAMYLPQIGNLNLPFGACRMLFLNCVVECVVDIIVAGVLCVIAALLWKKANHIHPTKSHNKIVQLLWNQLGIIMAGIIMAPLAIVMIIKNDQIEEKTKRIVAAVLAVVFLAAAAGSADYHPVTQDEVDAIIEEADEEGYTGDAYWTKYGRCYHFSLECQALRHSDKGNIYSGTLEEALEANRTNPCSFCVKSAEDIIEDASEAVDAAQAVVAE
ncbi:MAG: hypothetical protein IJV50_03140 [Lachnospiraceae bacterium]|nr:hypothetical protein [Lachnospiraceae bacterium]